MHGLLNYMMQNGLEEEYDTDDSNRYEMNNYFLFVYSWYYIVMARGNPLVILLEKVPL